MLRNTSATFISHTNRFMIHIHRKHWFTFCLLALSLTGAQAQSAPTESADEIIAAGLSALRQIDEDRVSELWDRASATIKARIPRAEFASGVRQARQTVGTVRQRTWAGVIRIQYQPGSVDPPAGMYANVDYSTQLADGRTVFEKVTLRLEPDGWRMTGYVPRQQQ